MLKELNQQAAVSSAEPPCFVSDFIACTFCDVRDACDTCDAMDWTDGCIALG